MCSVNMKKIEWKIEITYRDYALTWIWHKLYLLLFKPRGYIEYINHYLEFGENYLIYVTDDHVLWHIPYEKLSHLEIPINSFCNLSNQQTMQIYIHTNDNDKYSLPHHFNESMIVEIKEAIEKYKRKQ